MSFPDSIHGRWQGQKQLYMRPGADPILSDTELVIDAQCIGYRWTYEGRAQQGTITLDTDGARFEDTWHQSTAVQARRVTTPAAIMAVSYAYGEDGDTAWSWRIVLCQRPTKEVVLQMFNTTPWGEEALAVYIVTKRAAASD